MEQAVDVVIRTAGQRERRDSLQRAICSVQSQDGVAARPIVVLTGHLPALAAQMNGQPGIKVHHVGVPVTPGRAASIGRKLVDADFYAFLDDDDEFLPHALATGLEIMRADPAVDLVVTAGYWISGNERRIHIPDIARHQHDPIHGIIERSWLSSCGGLYRASSISPEYFEALPNLCEWTWLAFRLALERRNIRFVEVATYNAYDTPRSQSKSGEFLDAVLGVLAAMRAQSLPLAAREPLELKYCAALHEAAERSRQARQLGKAWRFHLQSMRVPNALRYAAYTRKLLWTGKASSELSGHGGRLRKPVGK